MNHTSGDRDAFWEHQQKQTDVPYEYIDSERFFSYFLSVQLQQKWMDKSSTVLGGLRSISKQNPIKPLAEQLEWLIFQVSIANSGEGISA